MVKTMADGTVDAALSWPPYTTPMAKQLGADGFSRPAQSGQDFYLVLFVKERMLHRQPKAIEQFLAALAEALPLLVVLPRGSGNLDLPPRQIPLYQFRRVEAGEMLTEDLLFLPTLHPLCPGVPARDPPVLVEHEDGVILDPVASAKTARAFGPT